MRRLGAVVFAALLGVAPAAAQDLRLAPAANTELRQMCAADRGRLWGLTLCGPLLVVDPASRAAWASHADSARVLRRNGDGWTGLLPEGVPIANTSVDWAGTRWIMVVGPLPEDATQRRVLIAHEAWHRIQTALGLAAQPSDCAHLETERGRYWLRLEFRALATAMRSRAGARRQAAREALMFRAARLAELGREAAAGEAALDRNEGLASYTGVKLGAGTGADMFAARTLDQFDTHQAYARAYAYASGPAYGVLLDAAVPNWRGVLGPFAPADLLTSALRPPSGNAARLREAVERYGGPIIARQERTRAEEQRNRIAALRSQYADGPRLELPLTNMQMEFDPNQVTPIEGLGSVYAILTIRDAWGELRATQGALISADFTQVIVAAPDPTGLAGPGWRLGLTPAYRPTPPNPDGRRTIVPNPQR